MKPLNRVLHSSIENQSYLICKPTINAQILRKKHIVNLIPKTQCCLQPQSVEKKIQFLFQVTGAPKLELTICHSCDNKIKTL